MLACIVLTGCNCNRFGLNGTILHAWAETHNTIVVIVCAMCVKLLMVMGGCTNYVLLPGAAYSVTKLLSCRQLLTIFWVDSKDSSASERQSRVPYSLHAKVSLMLVPAWSLITIIITILLLH